MAASLDDIKRWVNSAKERNCTHLIVVCDSYDFNDYPVYDILDKARMQKMLFAPKEIVS